MALRRMIKSYQVNSFFKIIHKESGSMFYLFHAKDNSTFAFAMPYLVLVKGLVIDARGIGKARYETYEHHQIKRQRRCRNIENNTDKFLTQTHRPKDQQI